MKQVIIFIILGFSNFVVMAREYPTATPKTNPDFPRTANIWIPGGLPTRSDIPKQVSPGFFEQTILRILSEKPEVKNLAVKYDFIVDIAGQYEFFAAMITAGRAWGSKTEFRFDQTPWTAVPVENSQDAKLPQRQVSWGISNAVSWNRLGQFNLTAGKHSLEMRVIDKTAQGRWSFMLDGIAGFLTDKIDFRYAPQVTPQPRLDAVASSCPELPVYASIWVAGGSPEQTNINNRLQSDSFSQQILYSTEQNNDTDLYATYKFEVKKTAEYTLFAALLAQRDHNNAKVEFSIDNSEFFRIRPSLEQRSSWGKKIKFVWEHLINIKLTPGVHELTLRTSSTNAGKFACDGIVGFITGVSQDGDYTRFPLW